MSITKEEKASLRRLIRQLDSDKGGLQRLVPSCYSAVGSPHEKTRTHMRDTASSLGLGTVRITLQPGRENLLRLRDSSVRLATFDVPGSAIKSSVMAAVQRDDR